MSILPTELFNTENANTTYNDLIKLCPDDISKMYWKWFVALNQHPRPSGYMEEVSNWVLEMAKKIGLESKKDKANNVVVYIPASEGMESKPIVCLQAHLDMVSAVAEGYSFDFEKQPIQMKVEGELLKSINTTLGADDGAGVACCLTVMENWKNFKHPRIDVLFTTDEEPGLLGAFELKEHELVRDDCKYLINVDSEQWGEVTVSSAGCAQREITIELPKQKIEQGKKGIKVNIKELKGGHTGADIHLEKGIKVNIKELKGGHTGGKSHEWT